MSRFLPLILVLAMASGGNAAIELFINWTSLPDLYVMYVCETALISVVSDDATNYRAYLVLEDLSVGEWYNDMTVTPATIKAIDRLTFLVATSDSSLIGIIEQL